MGVRVKNWKGAYWVFVNHEGKRKAKRIGEGKAGKRAADLVATKLQAKLADGDSSVFAPNPAVIPTVQEYAEHWLCSEAALRLKPITIERYTSVVQRHLIPAFGDFPLPALSRNTVKSQLAVWLKSGKVRGTGPLRPGSAKLLIATLRAILNTALEDGLIAANPAVRLGRHIRDEHWIDEGRPDPFTADESQQLLTAAEEAYPEWQVFFLVMARTGLRVGECLALQPDDLDLARGTLWVRRTWTRGRLGSPKGNRSRAVDLSPQAVDALRSWLSVREAEAAVNGRAAPAWVFPSPAGGPWDDRWLRWHVWRALLRHAGLRPRGMHQLRHSYASLLIAHGAHPKYIQAQLGHASIQITMDVYGHLLPGSFAKLVNVLDTPTGRNLGATAPASLAGIAH